MENNISVIIPIVDFDDNLENVLDALRSIAENSELPNEVVLVGHKSEKMGFPKTTPMLKNLNIKYVEHEMDDRSFQSQVNLGVKESTSKYFTILQMDDTLTKNYIKLLTKYLKVNIASTIILPIIANVNNEGFIGFQNEIIWANGFADVLGLIDEHLLEEFHDLFSINGICMEKEEFLTIGGFKKSMRAKFDTEFLLRAIENGNSLKVLPKVGYTHLNGRKNSISEVLKQMTTDEYKFWVETALSEYRYVFDREIAFVKSDN